MNRFKLALFFSLVYYVLMVILNALALLAICFSDDLYISYPFFESQGFVFVFLIPWIFLFTTILGINKIILFFPLLYLIVSICVMCPGTMEGYDLMFHFNFEFSKWSYIIFEKMRNALLLENEITSFVFFNAVFFIYQVGLLYCSNKIVKKR